MIITQIPPSHAYLIPPRAFFDIRDAHEHGLTERTLKQVHDSIEAGESQLWIKYNDQGEHIATVVTRVVEFDSGLKSCIIEYLGGLDKHGIPLLLGDIEYIEKWAQFNGCKDIRAIGRKAWAKLLKPEGYDELYTIVGKQLGD